ncbi:MAG: pyridoxal-dependent decarboxylase, exosortase A system-associated, partial [Pseudomonadota bacterium]
MSKKKGHAELPYFGVRDACLTIGGVPVSDLYEQVGRVPFFAYDSEVIKDRISLLREKLPSNVSLHYAIKANSMPDVVQLIAPLVDGLDVASGLELDVALTTDTAPHCVSMAGPGK